MPIDMAFAALVRDRPTRFSCRPIPYSSAGAFKLCNWRRAMRCLRHILFVTLPNPGGTNTADAWKESKLRSDYQNKKLSSIESKNVTPKEASGKMLQSDLSSSYFSDQTLLRPRTAIPPAALSHPSRPPYPSLQ